VPPLRSTAVDIVEDKGEDFATGSTSILRDHATTMMDAPPPLLARRPLPLRGSTLQRDDRTAGAKNAAASAGYHCGQSWHRRSRHGQQWRRDKRHGSRRLAAESHRRRRRQRQRSMSMTPVCSSSSDNVVSARRLSVVSNPLELLSRHPRLWDLGGWRREAMGYDEDDNNDRRRT
jgi:hypothetical protein